MLEMLFNGFADVISIGNIGFLVFGVMLGTVMGAIPGLTATMAIALIIPMTFYMDPVRSLIMLIGAYNGGIFGGSISAILLSTPGTPASAATSADGFALAKQGKAMKAMKMALLASIHGCLFSTVILILVAAPIAKFALKFGPGEYTVLMMFSLTIIGSAAGKSVVKGLMGGALGLLFSMVGLDPIAGIPRLTFSIPKLTGGIDLVVMLIGLLAVSEIFVQIEKIARGNIHAHLPPSATSADEKVSLKEWKQSYKTVARSSVIGCVIGALPALGPTLAAYLGYDMAKRSSKHPEEFGKGSLEGVAASEAANNAVCGANLIPLLAFGVPGDLVAAILIGAFMIQGITPGPLIFREAPHVVYGLYAGLIVANIVLLCITWFSFKWFAKVAQLSTTIIYPVVIMFCLVGVYALNQSLSDVWLMLFFSVLGYFMIKFDFTPATFLIGFILGPLFERNLRQALLISQGSFDIFFASPITWFLWIITAVSIFTLIRRNYRDKKTHKETEAERLEF